MQLQNFQQVWFGSHQTDVFCDGTMEKNDDTGGFFDLFVTVLNRGIDTTGVTDFTPGSGATIGTKHLTNAYTPQGFQEDTTIEVDHTPP